MKYSIGEFSKMTSLSIKSLRLYHKKEVLVPAVVDEFSGYRYYNDSNYEAAKTIKLLKTYNFTLAEIRDILAECEDESELLDQLEEKLKMISQKIHHYNEISQAISMIIQQEKESTMKMHEFEVEEKELDTLLIAAYRMKGKYHKIGKGFGIVGKAMGRHINGKALALYYDGEYKEDDANYEACFPIRKGQEKEGISVRELKGGKCVCLLHKGPYDYLGESYKKLYAYLNEKGYKAQLPTREVYLKGPGMIFKGNPKNYLTEIQVLIEN